MSATEPALHSQRMGQQPLGRLLITMALPLMASNLIQALYNIVDSMFVARLSQTALNAVSLAFPIQNLIIAVAVGTGVGMSTRMSHQLGSGDRKGAARTGQHGIILAILSWLLFILFGLLFSRSFIALYTDDPATIQMGSEYLEVVTTLSIGVFIQIIMERLLLATGRTTLTMWTQLLGAVLNIIFDPLFIFGIGPFPELGVRGAAVATVLGQISGAILGIILNRTKNREVSLDFRGFRMQPGVIKQIYMTGLPQAIIMSITSVLVGGMNAILSPLNALAVNVMGVYFKVQSFVFMPVFGITNAMVPIIAYNYGAQKRKRILGVMRLAVRLIVAIMILGTLGINLFPEQILNLFSATPEMYQIGIPALRIISAGFPLAGIAITVSASFAPLAKPMYAMFSSFTRQLIVLLPSAYLLSRLFGLEATWYAFIISEIVSLLLVLFLFRSLYKNRILTIPDEETEIATKS